MKQISVSSGSLIHKTEQHGPPTISYPQIRFAFYQIMGHLGQLRLWKMGGYTARL